jgi:two-component system chemotaxis response regulator CheB
MVMARKRVLVVDDSPLMRRLISEIVESDPDLSVVDVAENGRIALDKVRQHQPDVVLLDIEMPELSGLDTLRRLRLRSTTKVVILSHLGHDGARIRAEAHRLGAADVIDKPTASVSPDLRNTRGSIILQTLRRVVGLPSVHVPDRPLPRDGAMTTASVLSIGVQQVPALYERIEVGALVGLLNEQLASIEEAIRGHGGAVDGYVGAATLAVFGAPTRRTDHAARAVAAATAILDAAATRGGDLALGAVVVTDVVLAADFGPAGLRRYRTMGTGLDHAVRLGRANQQYGAELIVCGQTYAALPAPPARRLDVVQPDADSDPIELYEILRADADSAAADAYGRGLALLEAGQPAAAIKAFDAALQRRPTDRAALRLLARCRSRLTAPPAVARQPWATDEVDE